MGWIITFLILFLLAILPLGASICYDEDGLVIKVIGGPVRFTVFPMRRKKKAKPKDKPKQEKTDAPTASEAAPAKPAAETKQKKGGSLLDFLPLVKIAVEFLGDFRRKLRLNHLELKLILAGGDPCDLAVNYGRAWAALGNLLPMLERFFEIKKRDLEIECDFVGEETLIQARLDISITLGRIISLAVVYGIRALITFLKIMKKRKGGAAA